MADVNYAVPQGAPIAYEAPPTRTTVDGALILGLAVALSLIVAAMAIGGSLWSFFNLPSVLIVVFGTAAVTMISFSLRESFGMVPLVAHTMFPPSRDARAACQRVLNLAEVSRRNGVLALDHVLPQLSAEPFLQRAIALAVDGATAEQIESVLHTEIEATGERMTRSANILRRAAEVAPAMGLIGTLVGLIQMLARLDDPSTIGPAMAVALLTTFYGAVMAYMVFAPVAAKIDRNASDERLMQQIYTVGATSIARQKNPRALETLLNTVLPPSQRLDYYR